ncbi:MAG TPA: carboxypeptidase regulatory-like domain-containing protein, partial [Bryobacteraceae bacterium]|nr:carboxypeptidase regulatory-like domain-containing protein [Bryobacteraceae bacterium]
MMNRTAIVRTSLRAIISIAVVMLLALPAFGQLYTGSLTGTVLDPSGGPVADARVSLRDVNRNVLNSSVTDQSGRYVFRSLSPSDYLLRVEAPGFAPFETDGIIIEVDARLAADAHLKLAPRRDEVVVRKEATTVQTENATMGLVLDERNIEELPLVDRNPFDLAFLAPGVSQATGTTYGNGVGTPGFVTNFVSDGSRNAQADLLLDGVSVMNSDNNPGVQKALYVPPVEAIQEYKIQQTNFSAEFGNSGGTIVNVITRSGTNQYHGELFEFLRNNDLNANTFFGNAAGLAQPHLTRNDFGGTVGGPIRKNKTFFFFDFNGIRALTGQTSNLAGVPDAAERSGNFGELCARVGGSFSVSGICSNPAGQIFDPYTSQPNAQNNASGRAPVPFDNLATYISPGNSAIPFGLGTLPQTPG